MLWKKEKEREQAKRTTKLNVMGMKTDFLRWDNNLSFRTIFLVLGIGIFMMLKEKGITICVGWSSG
jgi:hypothetical protein